MDSSETLYTDVSVVQSYYMILIFPNYIFRKIHIDSLLVLSCRPRVALPFLTWCHHLITHVGTFVVVKVNDITDNSSCILKVFRPFHAVQPFLLYYTIDTFGNGIVGWLVVLCHRDGSMNRFQQLHIGIAAIL